VVAGRERTQEARRGHREFPESTADRTFIVLLLRGRTCLSHTSSGNFCAVEGVESVETAKTRQLAGDAVENIKIAVVY